jgi:hypothetical protein
VTNDVPPQATSEGQTLVIPSGAAEFRRYRPSPPVAKRIPVTSTGGIQLVALAFAAALGVSAYYFATTGWGTPFRGCWPGLSQPAALSVAALEIVLALGFVLAALRVSASPGFRDSLLVTMVLALFAALAVGGGIYTLATGVARFRRSGCLEVGTPWSYGFGVMAIFVGALALFTAVMTVAGRAERD